MRRACIVLVALLAWPSSASAELYAAAAAEVHVAPALSGNGIVIGEADLGDFRLRFNTDTLDVSGGFRLSDRLSARVGIAGEAFAAGVFTNYYQAGALVPERAFSASWAGPYVELKQQVSDHLFVSWRPSVRRWWFGGEKSSDVFVVPTDFTALQSKTSLTYWNFVPDRSQWEPHRLFRRLRGFGAGIEGEFAWRTRAADWGVPSNGRNDAAARNFAASQWAALGVPIGPMRLQVEERARIGVGEDDIDRARVGGFNPYTVPVAGLGWPAFLTSRLVAGQASLHVPIAGESEAGLLVDAVTLEDPAREGRLEFGAFGGAAAFLDARWDDWQVDARFGWAFGSSWLAREPQLGAFLAVGRKF